MGWTFYPESAFLQADDLSELIAEPEVLGLAELMNVPGLLACDEDILKKNPYDPSLWQINRWSQSIDLGS